MTKTSLEKEVKEARLTISSDGYPMSVGELTNMYREGELKIRPEFQRFFRWDDVQKSRLIESLILGIPLPSIFVAQTETGVWEVVDGLQRISTILQLQGELFDANKQRLPPLKLLATKYLPSLEGRVWQDEIPEKSLSEAIRLDIKRSKIDIKIIKRDSSSKAKFDLFQRLNSYGSILNSQELRSALLVAASPEFFAWVERLSRYPAFLSTTALSDKLIEERYDLELVTRFLVLHNWPDKLMTLSSLRDLPQILDDQSVKLAEAHPNGSPELADIFQKTFDVLEDTGGEELFKRWDTEKQQFKGSFLNTSFEVFALGMGYRIANGLPHRTDLRTAVKDLWSRPNMQRGFATGRSTEARLLDFLPLGRELTGL